MGTLTSSLIVSLIDRVSGPAKGVGAALKGVAAAEKKLVSAGAVKGAKDLTQSLERMKTAAKGLNFYDVTKSFSKFNLTGRELKLITRDFERLRTSLRGMKADVQLNSLRAWSNATVNDLRRVRGEMTRLESAHSRLGHRVRGAVRTGAYMVTGGGLTYGMFNAAREGTRSTAANIREGAKDTMSGMSSWDSAAIKETALKVSAQYPSLSMETMHQVLREAANSMGSVDKAIAVANQTAKALVVMQSMSSPEQAIGEMQKFFQAMDTVGKNIDPKSLSNLIDAAVRIKQVQGMDFDMGMLRTGIRRGKGASSLWSDRFLSYTLSSLMLDLSPDRAGNALSALSTQLVAGRAPKQSKELQKKYGLRDKKGNVANVRTLQSDPDLWIWGTLIPALAKNSVDVGDDKAVQSVVSQLFGRETAVDAVVKMVTQREQYQRLNAQYAAAAGSGIAPQLPGKDPFVALEGFTSQLKNLVSVVGEGPMKAAVSGLNSLTAAIASFTKAAAENPVAAAGGAAGVFAGGLGGTLLGAMAARGMWRWFTTPKAFANAAGAVGGPGGVGAAAGVAAGGSRLLSALKFAPWLAPIVGSAYNPNRVMNDSASMQFLKDYQAGKIRSWSSRIAGAFSGVTADGAQPDLLTGGGIWGGGAKPVDFLDGSVKAAGAGQKTGEAFKSALETELNRVDATIAAAVQRWTGMLGFSVSPTITPNISNPPAQRQGGLSGNKHAMHADYGFGTTG